MKFADHFLRVDEHLDCRAFNDKNLSSNNQIKSIDLKSAPSDAFNQYSERLSKPTKAWKI